MKVMIWNAARGGMRSVVESYVAQGFIAEQDIKLIHSYADGSFLFRQALFVGAMAKFLFTLATSRVDLVHCHAAMRGSFWRKSSFAALAGWFKVPVLFHLHGSEMQPFFASQPPYLQRLITRRLESVATVIVLSESWRQFVSGIAPRAQVVVVPNFVVAPTEAIAREPHEGIRLLFMGAVGKRKGIYDLLEALAALNRQGVRLKLLVGGDGELDFAKALAGKLGLADQVTFLGWVSAEERTRLTARSDVYVLPSYNEGLPMSVLEAMAAGLPVISSTVGGIPELIRSDVDGVLVGPGDVKALAEALRRLASNDALRAELAFKGRERVLSCFSHTAVLGQLRALYASVMSSAGLSGGGRATGGDSVSKSLTTNDKVHRNQSD